MKQKIRLTEGDLHRIVKKCINKSLNETYGYDEDDEWIDLDREITMLKRSIRDIEDGKYDTRLQTILNLCDKAYYSELFYDLFDHGDDPDAWIRDAAKERLCIIDKDYAFKNGEMYPYNRFRDNPEQFDYSTRMKYGNQSQEFKNNRRKLSDDLWKKHEEDKFKKKFPNLHKALKNGYKGMTVADAADKDVIGTNQYNKRPLHRKGSLNRAFDEDNNISEGKLHKIIRRCVNEELKSKRY